MRAEPLYVRIVDFAEPGDGFQLLPDRFFEGTVGEACFGPCINCRTPFLFNAENVISVRLSVPDMEPNPLPGEESEKFPVCNTCVVKANTIRKTQGLEPVRLSPDSSR